MPQHKTSLRRLWGVLSDVCGRPVAVTWSDDLSAAHIKARAARYHPNPQYAGRAIIELSRDLLTDAKGMPLPSFDWTIWHECGHIRYGHVDDENVPVTAAELALLKRAGQLRTTSGLNASAQGRQQEKEANAFADAMIAEHGNRLLAELIFEY